MLTSQRLDFRVRSVIRGKDRLLQNDKGISPPEDIIILHVPVTGCQDRGGKSRENYRETEAYTVLAGDVHSLPSDADPAGRRNSRDVAELSLIKPSPIKQVHTTSADHVPQRDVFASSCELLSETGRVPSQRNAVTHVKAWKSHSATTREHFQTEEGTLVATMYLFLGVHS